MKLLTDNLEFGTFILEKLDDILPTYPIIADKGATYPFCLYRRIGFEPKNTKDVYNFEEVMDIEIIVASTTYKESIKQAQKIKDVLEGFRGEWRTTYINSITMNNTNEDWVNDAYVQRMYFTISLDNERVKR